MGSESRVRVCSILYSPVALDAGLHCQHAPFDPAGHSLARSSHLVSFRPSKQRVIDVQPHSTPPQPVSAENCFLAPTIRADIQPRSTSGFLQRTQRPLSCTGRVSGEHCSVTVQQEAMEPEHER